MKVNLFDGKFDLDKLLYEIHIFKMDKGESPNYIVMSRKTLYAIGGQNRFYYVVENRYLKNNKGYTCGIFGIPIAYNETLQFGVVDIV